MSVQLSRDSVRKLTHECPEIRLRTLEQLDAKFRRALAHNETIDFRPGDLCKQLIRWFGFQPMVAGGQVLQLLLRLLRSPYGDKAVEQLHAGRFIKEMDKVAKLLRGCTDELAIVELVRHDLRDYQRRQYSNGISDMMEALSVREAKHDAGANVIGGGVVNSASTSKRTSAERRSTPTAVAMEVLLSVDDYELAWSTPTVADYNALKMLADIFANPQATSVELQKALQHLQVTLDDYPAEYMLQAPSIFLAVLGLLDRTEGDGAVAGLLEDICGTLRTFLDMLNQRLRMRRKTISYAALPNKVELHGTTQLRTEPVLQLLLDTALQQLQAIVLLSSGHLETLQMLQLLMATVHVCRMQGMRVASKTCARLSHICRRLQQSFALSEHFILQRIKFLLLMFLLQDMVQTQVNVVEEEAKESGRRPFFLDEEVKQSLWMLLRDYAVQLSYPQRHERLKALLLQADPMLRQHYAGHERIMFAYRTAVVLLRNPQSKTPAEIMELAVGGGDGNINLLATLDRLQSQQLVSLLFTAVVECNEKYATDEALRSRATYLLLQLLRLQQTSLKSYVYAEMTLAVKKHFAFLMNSDSYCRGSTNERLLGAQIVGVPLSAALLQQIVNDAYDCVEASVRSACMDILQLLLKAQHLLGAEAWRSLLEQLQPVLPLLLCLSGASIERAASLRQLLLKLFDPDGRMLPHLTVLQGNVGLLFHPDRETRAEALTRLIYALNTLPDAGDYVPNIMDIGDLLPNDLCVLATQRELRRIFPAAVNAAESGAGGDFGVTADRTTMRTLLSMLETPEVEPLVRKTTLMQLNVMCQNRGVLSVFCAESASYLVLQALENALHKRTYADYMDAAIPAISLLSKALLEDSGLRRELAGTPNIYMLLLRALFLYHNDIQVRQDASLCLFQLIFADFLLIPPAITGRFAVEAPAVLGCLQLPLKCEVLRTQLPKNTTDEETQRITVELEEEAALFLRSFLAATLAGDLTKINHRFFEAQREHAYFTPELHLTVRDWRMWKATRPAQNIRRFLRIIANATDHTVLINAATMLRLQLLLFDCDPTAELLAESVTELTAMLGKYLQLAPGNEMDHVLYEELLDLWLMGSRQAPLAAPLIGALATTIYADFQHVCVALLRNAELPLRLFRKLCQLLQRLVTWTPEASKSEARLLFHSNLFEYAFELADQIFGRRDLQRVRCLLALLQLLAQQRTLLMPHQQLRIYVRRTLDLSVALRCSTQTGAQWQRDCLRLMTQLLAQLETPPPEVLLGQLFGGTAGLRYLSALAGHNDVQVRALAWCLLAVIAQRLGAEHHALLINELAYLPGGFLACCLSTLLDEHETILVRQLAGQLFVALLSERNGFEVVDMLLARHSFFAVANASLSGCVLTATLSPCHLERNGAQPPPALSSCELVSCYARICLRLLELEPTYVQELCTQPFILRLYELLKLPPPPPQSTVVNCGAAYSTLCADICQLYAACHRRNAAFLQRTLCRDKVWLHSFSKLLIAERKTEGVADAQLVCALQLLLALVKDATAYAQLCAHFAQSATPIARLFVRAFSVQQLHTPLQRNALAAFTLLLVKTTATTPTQCDALRQQPDFAELLEHRVALELSASQSTANMTTLSTAAEGNKENQRHSANLLTAIDAAAAGPTISKTELNDAPASVYIFFELHRLFAHLSPVKSCRFDAAPPSAAKQQIGEALAMLLRHSPQAQEAAANMRLFERLLRLMQTFFEECQGSGITCASFVRRYGETRKSAVIRHFQLLFNILLHWFASSTAVLSDERQAVQLCRMLQPLWPWLGHCAALKLIVLEVCAHLSERSLVVCQQFSTLSAGAMTVLQLVAKYVSSETCKVRAASSEDFPLISTGLRVLINCCACAEGRVSVLKSHVLDIFDSLHPFNPKSPRIRLEILHSWLQFWELFTRYPEGAQARNLNALCEVINRSPVRCATRRLSLKILRNMCFQATNRSTLLASADFVYTVNEIIAQPIDADATGVDCEEHMLMAVAIWKLVSSGVKFVTLIRSTKLAKRMRILREQLAVLEEENAERMQKIPFASDLCSVLDVIFSIFNS